MFCDFEFFHDHRRALELWEDILFSDEYRYSIRDVKSREDIEKVMLVLEEFDHLIHLIADDSPIAIEIVREPEIVGCPEIWDAREGDLTRDLRQSRDEIIECIIDTIDLDLSSVLFLRFDEDGWKCLHKIVDEYPESTMRGESSGTIVRLKYESHLFETHHIVADRRG